MGGSRSGLPPAPPGETPPPHPLGGVLRGVPRIWGGPYGSYTSLTPRSLGGGGEVFVHGSDPLSLSPGGGLEGAVLGVLVGLTPPFLTPWDYRRVGGMVMSLFWGSLWV